jgi:hypothetical protein
VAQLQNTLSQYVIRVRRWLQEPTASKSFWTDNFLKQLFNTNYRLRCTDLHLAFEGAFINVVQTDIVANQARYAWPPNFQRMAKLELVRSDGTRIPLRRFERHEGVLLNDGTAGGDQGYLPTYRPIGSGFELEPGPTEDQADGIRMEYYGIPVELEADSDTMHADFPQILDELLVIDTAISALHSEMLMESQGLMRTLERERERWEDKWNSYIESRMISRQAVTPFAPSYFDY